jgi:hypothetical protein
MTLFVFDLIHLPHYYIFVVKKFYWWRKSKYLEKTTNLSQVYHILLYEYTSQYVIGLYLAHNYMMDFYLVK